MKYVVVYEQTGTGWCTYLPDLPGCVAAGGSKAETEKLVKEAIAFHLEGLQEAGEEIPKPEAYTQIVEVSI